MRKKSQILLALFVILCGYLPVYADYVLEAINEAVQSYKGKEYSEAVESLDYAKQLIQQLQNESVIKFLPKALSGWEAEAAESQTTGMFGGMASVERTYRKIAGDDRGSSQVTITILGKSPMLQGMMAMFNPMVVGSDGGKLQKIRQKKAIVKYDPDNRDGEIHVQVNDNFMVTIKGNSVSKEDLMQYAEAVDYKGLDAF